MEAEGIEPDRKIAAEASRHGRRVRVGYFPDAIPGDSKYDIVSFHDVLEHIGDLRATLAACRTVLNPGGFLVVSAPDSRGILFRTACALAVAGWLSPLERIWQVGYPSPHVSYFDGGALDRLVKRYGFQRRAGLRLKSLTVRGLWQRVHMDRPPGAVSVALFVAMLAASAVLRVLPSDQRLHVFQLGGPAPLPQPAHADE